MFISANDLWGLLSKARKNNMLEEKLTLLCRNKLLIIDELGFPLDGTDDRASLFYTLIAKRHEKLSTVITINRSIKDWPHYLGDDVQCTKASIDRFMQYAIPIKFEGESYWMRNTRQRITTGQGHEVKLVRDITL